MILQQQQREEKEMKFKSKSKSSKESSKSNHRTSKAADAHLDEEIEVWANDSFTSVASSVTAPPSQTASFYKRVQNDHFDFSSSDESESLQEGQTNRSSDDDNLSWADNRSRSSDSNFGGGDSQGAVQKPSKKDKKKRFRKGRRKLFGGAIQEDHDAENEDAAPKQTGRRGRRLSLFGNSAHSTQVSDNEMGRGSTDGEFSVNHSSDDGCPLSQDGSHDGGLANGDSAAPDITRGKAKRRGSLGGYFSRKENQVHQSDDVGHRSQDGSKDGLGYEEATPSISREKPKRRGSLGGLFTKKEHNGNQSDDGGHLSQDEGLGYGYEDAAPSVSRENGQRRGSLGGHFAKKESHGNSSDDGGPLSQDGSVDDGLEFGDEEAAPVITREKTKRRGSLGGLFKKESRHSPPPPEGEVRHEKPYRARRNSLFGGMSGTEHTTTVHVPKHDQPSVNEQSTTAASALSSKAPRTNRRRHSLTGGGSVKGGSSKSGSAPKDPHWIINQERKARGMPLYERSLLLDTLARSLSTELAAGLPPTPTEFYGNVGRGKSLQMIHDTIMDDRGGASRKNILSEKFTEFGVALTQGNDGQFYMVALFKE